MMSRFMANRPISVSIAKPPTVSPPPIFWKSQTTSSRGKGICCLASNLTMSGIFFSSTGGSLTNRTSPLWPGMLMAISSLPMGFREKNFSSASRVRASGSASGWDKILACSMKSYPVAVGLPSIISMRRALRAHWPISMPQTPMGIAMLSARPGVGLVRPGASPGGRVGVCLKVSYAIRRVRSSGR